MEISLRHPAEASVYKVQKLDKAPPAYVHLKVPISDELRLIKGDFGFVFSQFRQSKDYGVYKFDLDLKKETDFCLTVDKRVDALFMTLKNSFFYAPARLTFHILARADDDANTILSESIWLQLQSWCL